MNKKSIVKPIVEVYGLLFEQIEGC